MELLKNIFRSRKEQPEETATLQDIIENLRLISRGERLISDFYQLCGDMLTDEKDFWHALAASERAHSEVALKMANLIGNEPEKYRPGRSFKAASIRLFGLHLDGLIENMRAGKVQKNELFAVAADIESSVSELNYGEIVETNVPEFLELASRLEIETGEHRQEFEHRLKEAIGH